MEWNPEKPDARKLYRRTIFYLKLLNSRSAGAVVDKNFIFFFLSLLIPSTPVTTNDVGIIDLSQLKN